LNSGLFSVTDSIAYESGVDLFVKMLRVFGFDGRFTTLDRFCRQKMIVENSVLVSLTFANEILLISAEELRKLTKNYRLGLGTFVDKTTMPYVSLEEQVLLRIVLCVVIILRI